MRAPPWGPNSFIFMQFSAKKFAKQECVPVGCVQPARYRTGGLADRDPPGQRSPPRTETPSGQRPPPPPVNTMTHRCKNITFLQLRCGW